jgi:hypothetical protein
LGILWGVLVLPAWPTRALADDTAPAPLAQEGQVAQISTPEGAIGEPGAAASEGPPILETPSAAGVERPDQPSPGSDPEERGAEAAGESTPGEWLSHRVELLDELTLIQDADSLFNPGGALYATEPVNNALRLNGEFGAQLPAGITAKTQVASALSMGSETTALFSLRELYATLPLGDLELSVGRKILRWTNGYAFNPAGLLEPRRSPSDPQDRLKLLEGLEMAQLDYFMGDHVFTAVFSSDALSRTKAEGRRYDLALRGNILLNAINLDLALEALVSNIKNTGALTFSYVFGDALELHGEAAGTVGTSAQYPRAILPGMQEVLFGNDYLAQLKFDERRLFLRYVVGVNYTLPWGTNLIGEFYHSDEGLSGEEWERFIAHANFSRAELATGAYPPVFGDLSLPAVNLLQGLQQLGQQSIRRNYLFLRASDSWLGERLAASVLGLINLDDLSALAVGEVSYLVRRGAVFYARLTLMGGHGTSEFGNLGRRGSLNAGVQLSF